MRFDFGTYLLVSLVSLAHVVALAALLPRSQGTQSLREFPEVLVDDDGVSWIGPSVATQADVAVSSSAEHGEAPSRLRDRARGLPDGEPPGIGTSADPSSSGGSGAGPAIEGEGPALHRGAVAADAPAISASGRADAKEAEGAGPAGRSFREIAPLQRGAVKPEAVN